ncbi:MAG: hypothetical protein ACYC38_14175, partial [Eubacteriales bacterium]
MRLRSGDVLYSAAPPGGKQAEQGRDISQAPPGKGGQAGGPGLTGTSGGPAAGGAGGAGTTSGGTDAAGTGTGTGGAVSPGQAAIEEKYVAMLQSLASGYESRVMALYSSGIQEIRSIPASDTQARASKAGDYYSAGLALEAECDGRFYKVLADFESELQANGYPTGKASQAQAAYENTKKNRAGQLIQMAMQSFPASN